MISIKRSRSPTDLNEDSCKKIKADLEEKGNMVDEIESNGNKENEITKTDIQNQEMKAMTGENKINQNNILQSVDTNISSETLADKKTKNQEELRDEKYIDGDNNQQSFSDIKTSNVTNKPMIEDQKDDIKVKDLAMEKCNVCGQFLNDSDIIYYQGHPQDAVEEFVALTNEKLVLAAEDGDIMERPQANITGFSIFDEQGHLCPIDEGLIENDMLIYMSGYLKSICCDCAEIDEDSVPVKDIGPIIEWFIHGFDGGAKNCITISTQFGEYNLMRPSADYTPLMNNLYEKIRISKVVVEYLEEYYYLQPTYEDLLEVVRKEKIPELDDKELTEEMLHKHAQFICDQVVTLQTDDDEEPLITLPCMRELIKLMGIRFGRRKTRNKIEYRKVDKKTWTKATTTPLVRKTFESFFTDQLDKTNQDLVLRRKRCGVCEACQLSDCGECKACRAMAKFGGHGRTKKACVRRLCPNMAVQQAEDSNPEDDDDSKESDVVEKEEEVIPVKVTGLNKREISWIGEPLKTEGSKVYYDRVKIDGCEYKTGDFVMVESSRPNVPALVAKIAFMWKDKINSKSGYFHAEIFIRSSETVLGEVGDSREVFLGDKCYQGAPLFSIKRKACVEVKHTPDNWFSLGGKEVQDETLEDDGKTYFYKKFYDSVTARFECLPEDPVCPKESRQHRFCPSCERKAKKNAKNIPVVVEKLAEKSHLVPENRTEWKLVRWRDNEYKKGCGVFLEPGTFKFKNKTNKPPSKTESKTDTVDEKIYTEYYRKSDNNLRGSNIDTGEPFCVGHIAAVVADGDGPLIIPQNVYLRVNKLYRPENTTSKYPQHEDLNVVYWSDEIVEVPFSKVMGICHLFYDKNIPSNQPLHEWLESDPNRIYFRQAFDKSSGQFVDVPENARNVGFIEKSKDKGKGKGKSSKIVDDHQTSSFNVKPLRCLDVFAGCGGLSEGLHQAGVADCKWAIENMEAAAHAYSMNNKNCIVFNEDCNALLKKAMSGAIHSSHGLKLPMQGEVELLCGGPPCQGFSGMNRFNSREYSNFKNSLVASYLSFCDYYRPKYFILENVRNFVAFKKGMVLKLTLRALLDMGYQCTFGILQAGNYGVPQTRRRLIILAAAPGFKLPFYPEPTHVFSRRACSLTTTIDGKRFSTNIKWDESAPRRTCTIKDAMSDLPTICDGANKIEINYGSMPESHFQRLMRSSDESAKLRDHICKRMAPIVQARILRIPTAPGSDWRDLPNISVTLPDGSVCKVLQYRYHDKKSGRGAGGALRGVCACAAGRACDPADRQDNTLIPWCLPHTANRHNNWAGLYGRVAWDGYFSTTVTDPEPMGKQGRVLHPEQPRVVSVRECARSQGFRDTYLFTGSLQDKHRQIGNAVPPPLGAALGRELKKALALSQSVS